MQTRQQAWFCSPPLWLKPAWPSLRTLSTSLMIGWFFFDKMDNSTESVYLASSRNTVPMFQLWLALHSWCQYLLQESQIFTHWGRFSKVFFPPDAPASKTFVLLKSSPLSQPELIAFLDHSKNHSFLAVQNSLSLTHSLTHSTFTFDITEWPRWVVTFVTFDQSDEETWPDQKFLPTHLPTHLPTCPPTLENILKVRF